MRVAVGRRRLMVSVAAAGCVVVVAVPGLLGLTPGLCSSARAVHADGERPPDREKHCEQQQDAEAQGRHGG